MVATLSPLLAVRAWGASWDVVPMLSLEETYTDNVSLAPDALKQGDWITVVTPGIAVNATGARARFNANYAPEIVYYAQGYGDNDIFHRGNIFANMELAEQLLFVDAGANVDQYNISLLDPLAATNINATGNRATVRTLFASPYLVHDFGSEAKAEARYRYSATDSTQDPELMNSQADRIDIKLESGSAYKALTWNLDYFNETVNYENDQDTASESILAKGRRLLTPTTGLLAEGGYEKYDSGVIAPTSEGSRWAAGFEWTPTPRSRLAATAGERFYGDTYFLDLQHRTRLTAWTAGYREDVTSARDDFFIPATANTSGVLDQLFSTQIPDPVARQKAVEEFIAKTGLPSSLSDPVNFFSNQLFLQKSWHASASVLGVRNVLTANVFMNTREVLVGNLTLPSTGDFVASNTIRQTGTGLVWNWRIKAHQTWNMDARYTRDEFLDIDRVDHVAYLQMSLIRQLQPRVHGSVGYRRQQNDSSESAASYTENAVFAALRMTM
jgi:uncharacterized protein (PEP-CTERM system associated)